MPWTAGKAWGCRQGSLGAQTVENLPALQETQVQSLGQKDSPGEENGNHSGILAWRIPWRGAWRATVPEIAKSRIRLSD